MEILQSLKEYSLFQELSEVELRKLAGLVKVRKYRPGQLIFNWGEAGGILYLIKKGLVEISIPLKNSDYGFEKVSKLTDGNYFGLLSFLDGKEHSARATAVNETEVLLLIKQDFEKFVQQDLLLGIELQTKIAARILYHYCPVNNRINSTGYNQMFQLFGNHIA